MQPDPFSQIPATPEGHFKLYFYAAILHVVDRSVQVFDSQEAAVERFPFLIGYINELAVCGLDGLTTAEALLWWRAGVQAWEESAQTFLPIRALQQAAGLSYEALTMYFCVGLPEEDPRFGVLFEMVQGLPGSHRVTYGLLNAWWADAADTARAMLQQLRALRLVEVTNPEAPRVDWTLQPAPLLWDVLSGRAKESLSTWAVYRAPDQLAALDELIVADSLRTQSAQIPALLETGDIQTLVVRGPQHNGRKTLIGAFARAIGCGVLEIRGLTKADDERWGMVGPLATLLHAIPVLTYDLAPSETAQLPQLDGYTGAVGVALGRRGGLSGAVQTLTLAVDVPAFVDRRRHWLHALAGQPVEALDDICERFHMTSGHIRQTAGLARTYARLANRQALAVGDVQQAIRTLNRQALDTLAAAVPVFGDWCSLAVGAETLHELRLLESRCRHRERLHSVVSQTLGAQMTTGVRALFSGPSGTGKTLAARILAAVLQMDLYRLDLSSVVNKYIGETEKNLNELFARAEELDVILLIDEGDALLTQRTDVQSSNDRYANLETNFLLQRLETYAGIVLITTNAGDRIDSAFQRRMDVIVQFRAPEAAERWAIWQLHLPPEHQVESMLLREVAARCTLTGGQIRNVVLHASVLALDDGGSITSTQLETAVQREYRKMGAVCPLRSR